MRFPKTEAKFYTPEGAPKYWSLQADDAWRSAPALKAERDEPPTIQDGRAVIAVDGPIVDDEMFGFSDSLLSKKLSGLDAGMPITLRVNSPGGIVSEGTAIRTRLLEWEGHVRVQVTGTAASAAQFITTGADEVWMAEGALQMIHRPFGMFVIAGDWEEQQESAAAKVKFTKINTQIYEKALAKKMKIPQSRVSELLKSETWYTAEEAVKAGLANRIHPVQESPKSKPAKAEAEADEGPAVGLTAAELVRAAVSRL